MVTKFVQCGFPIDDIIVAITTYYATLYASYKIIVRNFIMLSLISSYTCTLAKIIDHYTVLLLKHYGNREDERAVTCSL